MDRLITALALSALCINSAKSQDVTRRFAPAPAQAVFFCGSAEAVKAAEKSKALPPGCRRTAESEILLRDLTPDSTYWPYFPHRLKGDDEGFVNIQRLEYFDVPNDLRVLDGSVLCLEAYSVQEGRQAAAAQDSSWLNKVGCILTKGSAPAVKIEEPYPYLNGAIWKVRINPGAENGATAYGYYRSFTARNGDELDQSGSRK